MNQAVEPTQQTEHAQQKRPRSAATGSTGAGFDKLLATITAIDTQPANKPTSLRDAVNAELHGRDIYDIDDVAAQELQSPSRPKPALDVKPRPQSQSQTSGRPDRPIGSDLRTPDTKQDSSSSLATEPRRTETQRKSEPEPSKPHESQNRITTKQKAQTATVIAPATAVRSVGAGGRSNPPSSGVRSVGAIQASSGGKAILDKLAIKQQPPILRASKEQAPAQVSRALAQIVTDGGGKLTLRLNPRALGAVRIDVVVSKGVARATLDAQTPAARDLLQSELDTLRAALERRGVVVEHLEVISRSEENEPSLLGDAMHKGQDSGGMNQHHLSRRPGANQAKDASAETGVRRDDAEHSSDMTGQATPIRTDALGVVRVDAIA